MKLEFLGLPISSKISLEDIIDEALSSINEGQVWLTTFINPYSYWLAQKDVKFGAGLYEFDRVLCDGIGVVLGARWLGYGEIPRMSFDSTSLAPRIFKMAESISVGIFLVGGEHGVAHQAGGVIESLYKNILIVGSASGFMEDDAQLIEEIKASGAKILICGMGAPRQESFLLALKASGWKGAGFTCGGYFDQLLQSFNYYPVWVDTLNLRFLYRLSREPGRLWRRYFVQYAVFIQLFLKELLRRPGSARP